MPTILTFEQQDVPKHVCSHTLNTIENDPRLLKRIITCDESRFFTYDLETKRQSMQRKSPFSPKAKNARMNKPKFKAMMNVFIGNHGIVDCH
ncbi:putative mariner transposase [Trichonephila clavipes]|nr:putative mariner transposase [Trichonephila clavipes]